MTTAAAARPPVAGRLHPLAIVVYGWRVLRIVGAAGIVSLLSGGEVALVLGGVAIAVAVGTPLAVIAWRRFRYEVTATALEVRSGVLTSSRRTVPLERVRGVDISAPLLHRAVGLVSVRVDAAGGSASGLKLAAVRRDAAETLRDAVLDRAEAPGGVAAATTAAPTAAGEPVLARVSIATLALAGATSGRYLLVPLAALAALVNLVDDLPAVEALAGAVGDRAPDDPLALAAIGGGLVVVAVLVAALGSVLVDGNFTLTRGRGRVMAERGLLSRRSVSIDLRRVRALEVRDSLPWRALRLAGLRALVGGIADGSGDARGRTTLLPAAARAETWGLVDTLAPDTREARGPLVAHPPAARARRLVRALALPAAGAVVAGVAGRTVLAVALVALTALMVPLALDRYRNLGHRLEGGWLRLSEGSLGRRQTLVDPGAVVAWRLRASPFQRRAGLGTLTAYLGPGAGSRSALDIGQAQAVAVLARAEPEVMAPLLR